MTTVLMANPHTSPTTPEKAGQELGQLLSSGLRGTLIKDQQSSRHKPASKPNQIDKNVSVVNTSPMLGCEEERQSVCEYLVEFVAHGRHSTDTCRIIECTVGHRARDYLGSAASGTLRQERTALQNRECTACQQPINRDCGALQKSGGWLRSSPPGNVLGDKSSLESKPGFSVFSVIRGLAHSAGHRADQSGMLEAGVDRIISQVVDPKLNHIFRPQIERAIHEFLAAQKKEAVPAPPPEPESQDPAAPSQDAS
ncbi:hypothetical protein MJG53_012250 [Ovis ammon polii x Ovis aries]|uniref:Uncharacterized protein n=1 Tax=Ovis ammon polii x Ovis aries TaxID=2918886 RepID=A0ACB9UME5_9CETA|nr:hypothetical protein MJT46_011873 [Ovis ammon polii x Ovis aries]KAI4574074.1 hypothetical protein MJG53_012250 [Ovis ammon polii x Ovis aries]